MTSPKKSASLTSNAINPQVASLFFQLIEK